MRTRRDGLWISFVFLLLFGSLGCATRPDLEAERQALLQADRDFAAETARRGGDGWADYFVESGVMFPMEGRVDGRDAIRERMRSVFTADKPRLVWQPATAVVGSGGDLGYTLGRWQSVATQPGGGDSTLAEGNYVSIWRKVPGEGWKVAVDIGNSDPASP